MKGFQGLGSDADTKLIEETFFQSSGIGVNVYIRCRSSRTCRDSENAAFLYSDEIKTVELCTLLTS